MSQTPTAQLLNRLRMRQVALLLAIGRHRTLRAAAAELGMTQPAATKMLKELELTLGQPLFNRVGRGLQFSPAGRAVLESFTGLQGHLAALTRDLRELAADGAGRLRVGSIMAASPAVLSEALIQLKAVYPRLTLEITVDTSDRLIDGLRSGSLDLVIGRLPPDTPPGLDFVPMAEEALSLVVSPTHLLAKQVRLAWPDLMRFQWILQPSGSPMRELLEQEFRSKGSRPPVGLVETSSILTTTNLLSHSEMIAVIPSEVAQRYERHGMLMALRFSLRQRLSAYGLITQAGRPRSPAASELISSLMARTATARPAG